MSQDKEKCENDLESSGSSSNLNNSQEPKSIKILQGDGSYKVISMEDRLKFIEFVTEHKKKLDEEFERRKNAKGLSKKSSES